MNQTSQVRADLPADGCAPPSDTSSKEELLARYAASFGTQPEGRGTVQAQDCAAQGAGQAPVAARRAASYARKSDADSEGLDAQFAANVHRAGAHGYQVDAAHRFEDDDTVGTTKKRKGFDRLVALVTSGHAPFRRLYVKDKTRLGRWQDPRRHTYLEVMFEECGVQIVYCDDTEEPIDYDTADSTQVFGRYMKGAFQNFQTSQERSVLRRRVTGGMRARVKAGFYPGARAYYGTRRVLIDSRTRAKRAEIPQKGALRMTDCHPMLAWATDGSLDVVRRIFARALDGVALRRIAWELNEDGIASPGALRGDAPDDTSWHVNRIKAILTNSIYCGDLIWGRQSRREAGAPVDVREADIDDGREAVIYLNFMADPPISRADFFTVQRRFEENSDLSRRRQVSNPTYLLTGLLRCAHCEGKLFGFTHRDKRKDGGSRRYYRHDQRGRMERRQELLACPALFGYLRSEALEASVLSLCEHVLTDDRLARMTSDEIRRRLNSAQSVDRDREIRETRRAIAACQEQMDAANRELLKPLPEETRQSFERIAAGFGVELKNLRVRLETLEADVRLANEAKARQARAPQAIDCLQAFRSADSGVQKRALAEIVEGISVDPVRGRAEVRVRSL